MDNFWLNAGYIGECGKDGFPPPGELIKQTRIKKSMSQEQLAFELGCSRVMVTRMENENLGLNDIVTRRNLARILGIAPMMLGLVAREDLKSPSANVLHDTTLLKSSLTLHREVYFSGGDVGGMKGVDTVVDRIYHISKAMDHKNKEVLEILCHYGQLGLDIGREEQNYNAIERYGSWAESIARKLDDQKLLAATLMRHAAGMYEKGDMESAKGYADEALAQTHLPAQLYAAVILEASRVYGKMHEPQTMKLLEKATSIARKGGVEEDTCFTKLTPGFCYLRTAHALYEAKDYDGAMEILDLAEEQTTPNLIRRKCAIQVLQAQTLMEQSSYADATQCASTALTLATIINCRPQMAAITGIYRRLKTSSFGNVREVARLGKNLSKSVGNQLLVLPA